MSRRTGQTTRLVDKSIQILFEGNSLKCVDHYNSRESNYSLFQKILHRLQFEHGLEDKDVEVNVKEHTIKLNLNNKDE